MSSTGPKLAGSQPVAKPLATMVNTNDDSFHYSGRSGHRLIDLRPICVKNGEAWFGKHHLIKVSLSLKSWRSYLSVAKCEPVQYSYSSNRQYYGPGHVPDETQNCTEKSS